MPRLFFKDFPPSLSVSNLHWQCYCRIKRRTMSKLDVVRAIRSKMAGRVVGCEHGLRAMCGDRIMISHRITRIIGLSTMAIAMMGNSARAEYIFTTYTGTNLGTTSGTGTNFNGISNSGTVVGFTTPDNVNFTNFTANPLASQTPTNLNLNSTAAMAFGINSAGVVVGTDGNGNAFALSGGTLTSFLPTGGNVGPRPRHQRPGNHRRTVHQRHRQHAGLPHDAEQCSGSGQQLCHDQCADGNRRRLRQRPGHQRHGLIVGFYIGNDDEAHGFLANASSASNGMLTAMAIADPTIPSLPAEPGATFLFSQILSVNDSGIAVGYYQDQQFSQHGFFYNTNTGALYIPR